MEPRDPTAPPGAEELSEHLHAPLAALGLSFGSREAGLVARYLALLLPWNARVNLSGARSAAEMIDRHLADGFAVAARLPRGALRLIDVGAGAGFLGVAAAILRPELRCVLLEPIGKKYAFLRAVARELPLPNLEPRGQRLDAHLTSADFHPYDAAVSRATWPPAVWLEKARALIRPGGLVIAFEGREPQEAPAGAQRVAYRVGARRGTLLIASYP